MMKTAILIAICVSAPVQKRILACTAICRNDWSNSIQIHEDDTSNVLDFVKNCVSSKSYSDAQRDLYLDSVNGSCTEVIYEAMDHALVQLSNPTITACIATCRNEPSEPTVDGFMKCMEELGPGSPKDLEFLQSQFVMQGQCEFEKYNLVQSAMRSF